VIKNFWKKSDSDCDSNKNDYNNYYNDKND